MALSNEDLRQLISNLSQEERQQLFSQLKEQFDSTDTVKGEKPLSPPTKPTQKKITKKGNDGIHCCVYCGSARLKSHGVTSAGNQRYICKSCGKTFTENHGSAIRYTHIDKDTWLEILRGIVNNHSTTVIARDTGLVASTIWLCRQKVCNAIKDMYGYNDLFNGVGEADEYYCRAAFKGKRDAEFFIYTLRRMPRHHRNRQEKIDWLIKNNLYDRLSIEEPDYLEELLSADTKMKRGISNEQICILTLVDQNNTLYLEPVSVGRLEKAMAKSKLKQKFNGDNNVLVTDDHKAYERIMYGTGVKHQVVPANEHKKSKYNLAKVNSVHSALTAYMDRFSGRVYTTKYLDLTLMLFWWLFKYKDYSTEEKVQALYKIMIDEIPDLDAKERVDLVTTDKITNREITLDTKNQFPTKL